MINKEMDLFKMGVTRWAALVLAVFALATPATPAEPRVVCYYTNWSVYRPGTARFNPQNINPYLCTHLIYAFGGFTKDNTLKPFDKYQDIEKGGYAKFTGLKTYNKQLKTLLAIGGWNEGSTRFSPMVASREKRREFVRNAIKFLRQNHFDGLDLDWEYPAFRDGGKPKDRENYAKLVKELREEFQKESEKTNKPRLLLTMAVPAGIEYIQKGFDVKTLNEYLDWMNLLTYDFHSAFEPAVNHHAPLYPLEEPNEYSVDNELNIDYTIKFYLESGADPDKLVLGIPTYGRSYTLFNPDATEIGSPADGPGEQGDATREKGYLAYYEICEALKPKQKKKRASSEEDDEDEEEEEEDQPWTVFQPNPKAMGPYAYKGNQWVGYDDIDIVKKKAEYVAENGLGGIMFWSIDNDDFRGSCHGKPYPLIEAAKEAYIGRLGSTDNAVISTERPRSSSNRRRTRPSSTTTTAKSTTRTQARKSSVTSTTPSWNIVTPEPPTTPDPGSDFKCTDEGFFAHPRDCKKYFWCLDSGPSNLGIVAHQFTCPSGLFFNKAADSCDFARNVLCKKPAATTKAPKESTTKEATTRPTTRRTTTTTEPSTTTTRKPVKLSTKSSSLFRTTSTTTTTAEPEAEEYEDEAADVDAEDPKVIKELIDLIKKVGGVEQLEKQLHLSEVSSSNPASTSPPAAAGFNKKLYQKVLERTRSKTRFGNSIVQEPASITGPSVQNSRRGPQNEGLEASGDRDKLLRKDRPQYTTINRSRQLPQFETEPEVEARVEPAAAAAAARDGERVASTARPLQYVNIRRARPSDAADDTASRNALFERPDPYVSISETSDNLDISSARRENIPEYVTIRRQRVNLEETTTVGYQLNDEEAETQDSQETALERDISSVASPQYTSIVRSQPSPAPSSPEPTTILAVQISSLLNSPNVQENDEITTEPEDPTTPTTTTTTTTTTSTTTTTTPPPPPPRRVVSRRRSTTTTTTTPIPTTTQATKETSRRSFLRRTKATSPPDTTAPPTDTTETLETTTNKYTKRGNSRFKSRNEEKTQAESPAKTDTVVGRTRPPSLRTTAHTERTRKFVRRRLGPSNATATTTVPPATTSSTSPSSRRPFRVASRRRPVTTASTRGPTSSARPATVTTAEPPTTANEESLQDISGLDFQTPAEVSSAEITSVEQEHQSTSSPKKKTVKIQRRPLTSLKPDVSDQNPSATNEDESKRQSKKYSASFKQNQLDEVLKQKKTQESTTEGLIDEYNAETAIAIAAHQLMSAPPPVVSDYEDQSEQSTKKSSSPSRTTFEYSFTSPAFKSSTSRPLYSEEINPVFQSTITPDYLPSSTRTYLGQSPSGFTKTTSTYSSPTLLSSPKTSVLTQTSPLISQFSPSFGPSTARYVVTNEDKYPGVPVEDFGYSTSGYTGLSSQEPSYFTREYLLESPVTKTYDDQYQYLSPTTPVSTTPKATKKIIYRKISTTLRPTIPTFIPVSTTVKPRRVPSKKPFEKVAKGDANRTYRPIENYDYYDEGDDKLVQNYEEGTQVVLHGKGTIECLDVGNFPHPSSCKKFISCARMESGGILGWEYICPKGLSFDPVGGMCNWSAGLGCDEKGL